MYDRNFGHVLKKNNYGNKCLNMLIICEVNNPEKIIVVF